MARNALVSVALEQYFDDLGPGEVIDLANDIRGDYAFRFPEPAEEAPYRAGQAACTRIMDALGGSVADIALSVISRSVPDLPTDVSNGPNKITLGKVGIFELP